MKKKKVLDIDEEISVWQERKYREFRDDQDKKRVNIWKVRALRMDLGT